MSRTAPLLLALALTLAAGCASTPRTTGAPRFAALAADLEAAVPTALEEGKVCGAVILVGVRRPDGSFETWQHAWGLRCTEPAPEPMTPDSIFDLASMTKPIATGTAMMILLDQHRLTLDDPVARYLPEFAADPKSAVTIRHLMTHASGEKPYLGEAERKRVCQANPDAPAAALRAHIREVPLTGKPGEQMTYSCLNAALCAEIVRTITGSDLGTFSRKHIFQPLRMRDTGFLPADDLLPRICPTTRAPGGKGAGGFLRGQVHDPMALALGGVSGNAGLFASAGDVSIFAQMMLSGGERNGARILSPESVAAMLAPAGDPLPGKDNKPDLRGLLWDIYDSEVNGTTIRAVGHTGYTGTAIRIYPEAGVYAIVLANRVHPNDKGNVERLRKSVWQLVTENLIAQPTPTAP